MAKKTIIVNRHILDRNKKNGQLEPPISCQVRGTTIYGHEVILLSEDGSQLAKLIYDPLHPRDGGATVWLETECNIKVINRQYSSSDV